MTCDGMERGFPHICNIPGIQDQSGILQINKGTGIPKRNGSWNLSLAHRDAGAR